ncbi:MAG: hypothetical protein HETSPECPRED_002208 [Heterodermia speciosa]|uniref:Uncharacterized protein n=1 Tax=Heterodermia speciosa TaxID=116794 RepID=A0A8H3J3W3_9LECA|nr:MAG: hypothetical protein HETSPECPRED_002208 [Heterodermia speciosa]
MGGAVAWRFVLVILITPFLHSAYLPQASSVPNGTNISASAHGSIRNPSYLRLGTIKLATRQLIEHDAFMHIFYDDQHQLQPRFYRDVLTFALLHIVQRVELDGDNAPVPGHFSQFEGDVLLIADHVSHSPTRDLTWGVLGEAVASLQDFMRRRPFLLQAEIYEGLDGRGIPIGKISVGPYPLPTLQKGNVQAS